MARAAVPRKRPQVPAGMWSRAGVPALSQPDNEELRSPVTRMDKELTFKSNYINTAVSC